MDGVYLQVEKLQSVSRIQKIIQACKGSFTDEFKLNKFNSQPELFSFSDGWTYDLIKGTFRKLVKEDFILFHCGYPKPERNEEDVEQVSQLLHSIFEKEMDYALSLLSLFMYGTNSNEIFLIMKGGGRNGKGVIDTLLRAALGQYHSSLSTEQLTNDSKGKDEANSEIARARYARCLMASEPDDKKENGEGGRPMKTNLMKRYSVAEPLNVRGLYKDSYSFIPQWMLAVQCNDDPKYSMIDEGLLKRQRILSFPYQFVDLSQQRMGARREYHRQINPNLKSSINRDMSYRNGFLYLMLDAYTKYQGKIGVSEYAKQVELEYEQEQNPLFSFLQK